MKKNNKKKIIIISIFVIVLLLIAGVVFAFVATDMFKSNKDLFFRYASQLLDEENGFKDSKLSQYNKKKKNSSYEFIGEISTVINSETIDKTTLQQIDNMNISLAGNVDIKNDQTEALVKVNYTDKAFLPIYYKNSNGICGIKFPDILQKYFAVKNDNLTSFISKLGLNIDLSNIDMSKLFSSNGESSILSQKYYDLIKENLQDCTFLKVTGMNSDGYTLEVSNKKLQEIIVKILEELSKDAETLTKVNSMFGTSFKSSDISQMTSLVNAFQVSSGKSTITLYQKDGKLNKLAIQFNDMVNLSLTKTSTENNVSYNLSIETKNYTVSFLAEYTGLSDIQKVKENYELSIIMGDSYKYIFSNDVNFTNNLEITKFENTDYVDLNSIEKAKLDKLLELLPAKIDEANKEKMKNAEITDMNIWKKLFPSIEKFIFGSQNIEYNKSSNIDIDLNKKEADKNETSSNATALIDEAEKKSQTSQSNLPNETDENKGKNETSTNIVENMEKLEKETFNAKFLQYEGKNVRAATVKSLLMHVIATNMAEDERKIKVTGDITLTGEDVPDTIDMSKTYTVKCSTGLDEYIDSIEIKVNQ